MRIFRRAKRTIAESNWTVEDLSTMQHWMTEAAKFGFKLTVTKLTVQCETKCSRCDRIFTQDVEVFDTPNGLSAKLPMYCSECRNRR